MITEYIIYFGHFWLTTYASQFLGEVYVNMKT
jgi:hypothetical protein